MEKAAKVAKVAKGVASVLGVAGLALFTIYWFDLDDVAIKKMEPKLRAKSEAHRAQKMAAAQAAQAE